MSISLLSAILGLFTALPDLIKFGISIMEYLNKITSGNPVQFLKDLSSAMTLITNAQTTEEHANASKNLSDLIARMPSK